MLVLPKIMLITWDPVFLDNVICAGFGAKLSITRVFKIFLKMMLLLFVESVELYKTHSLDNCGSQITYQNALNQSDFKILILTISQEPIDESAQFFAYWYRFK